MNLRLYLDDRVGSKAKDTITGFVGVVVGATEWLNGCIRYSLQPRKLHENKPVEAQWFDEQQLEAVKAKTKRKGAPSGGPMPDPRPPTVRPRRD